jgi:hypothetical protein
MRTDTLAPRVARPPSAVDAAFAARPRLLRLRDALAAAAREPKPRRSRWGEPPVFFFDPARQAELEAARPATPKAAPHPVADLIATELPALFASAEVRAAARAIPGLREAAASLAPTLREARDLADLLAVPDDEAVLVLHPALRAGFRLLVRGVADVNQFHLLLLAAVTGDSGDGLLPGLPVPSRFVSVCRDADPIFPAGVPMVAEARFQLLRPIAVQPDGTVPGGFRGCDYWLWGWEAFAAVPRVDGERVVVLGEPAYRPSWEVGRRFPAMAAEVSLLDVLGPFQVAERLSRLAGRPVPVRVEEPRDEVLPKAA